MLGTGGGIPCWAAIHEDAQGLNRTASLNDPNAAAAYDQLLADHRQFWRHGLAATSAAYQARHAPAQYGNCACD